LYFCTSFKIKDLRMEYHLHTLPNGLRLIYKPDNMPVTYCGMVINAGSRDEQENQQGLAHFVEHLLSKGPARGAPGTSSTDLKALEES